MPGDIVVHRLWAGTKLLVAAELALMLSISPTWRMLGGRAPASCCSGCSSARIPLGAFPRLPQWFFIALAIGAALNLWSGVKPSSTSAASP